MCRVILGVIFFSFFEFGFVYAQTDESSCGYIDTHAHLNAQTMPAGRQENSGRGFGPRRGARKPLQSNAIINYDTAVAQLLAEMDKYNIEKAIIMPPPQIPQQRVVCDYKDLIDIAKKHSARIFFLGGGDTLNRMIHQYQPDEVTPQIRAQFTNMAEEIASSGAKGFGETAILHFSLSAHHVFEEAAADHPLFLLLADIAASRNMPIDLHMEAVPEDMNLPAWLSQISPNNPAVLHANIPAFERLLAHNKKAKIVWQHIGWDNTGYMTVELLRRLLGAHPNLYLSMRGDRRLYDMNGRLKPNRIVDENWNIRPEWLELITDFPDRFMIGTDDFFGAPVSGLGGQSLPQTTNETLYIVGQLPPELARKVGHSNAARVYNFN